MDTQRTTVGEVPGTSLGAIARTAGILAVVGGVVGLVVGFPLGLFWVAIPGALAGWFTARAVRNGAFDRAVSQVVARPATEVSEARILNVIDGLCVVSGDRRPLVEVIEQSWPVAFAVAGPGSDSRIVVSDGFVASMDRVETEAVMAHLLWRIRSGSAEFATWCMALHAFLSRFGLASLAPRLSGSGAEGPVDIRADLAACRATRYPPALVSALEKCRAPFVGTAVLAPLWFALPENEGATVAHPGFHSLGLSHSSLDERISILKEI